MATANDSGLLPENEPASPVPSAEKKRKKRPWANMFSRVKASKSEEHLAQFDSHDGDNGSPSSPNNQV